MRGRTEENQHLPFFRLFINNSTPSSSLWFRLFRSFDREKNRFFFIYFFFGDRQSAKWRKEKVSTAIEMNFKTIRAEIWFAHKFVRFSFIPRRRLKSFSKLRSVRCIRQR